MKKSIGIIGGDLRIVNLINLLQEDDYKVYIYGIDKKILIKEDIIICNTIEQINKNVNIIITSIPMSKDKVNIYSPFTDEMIAIEKTLKKLKGKTIISGAITKEIYNLANTNNVKIIDILENEELAILNAIPTAEGAIEIAMRESQITLHNSDVLVLGFGRIGKILSKMLYGIGANVFCEARKNSDIAKIKSYGYNVVNIEELDKNLNKYDFIFNTIPYLILDGPKLEKVKKECLIIDLASAPGGVNFKVANNLNIRALLELGLPGRVAPKTAASYIKSIIEKTI